MARPHLEFIHAQLIPWQTGLYGGGRPGVEQRTLSRDEESGAASLIIRVPPGWQRPEPEYLEVDEEFLVLDGSIEISGQVYGKQDYAHLPAGFARTGSQSTNGAVSLTFFSGEPHERAGSPPAGLFVPSRLVRHIDTRNMEGVLGPRKEMFPGLKAGGSVHKRLKTDPVTGELTWLVALRGGWIMSQMETHPVVEEEYALAGDQVGPRGTMRAGAYFWRPPGIQHGPFATATGVLHLVRSVGGPLTTELEEVSGPFHWDQPYDPILPPPYDSYVANYRDSETTY